VMKVVFEEFPFGISTRLTLVTVSEVDTNKVQEHRARKCV